MSTNAPMRKGLPVLTREHRAELRRHTEAYLETLADGRPWGADLVLAFERLGGEHRVILALLAAADAADERGTQDAKEHIITPTGERLP